jgi:phenylacetic acid degradation operon negative regulatory protein
MLAWDGAWIGAHTAGLARGNRTVLRQRTRALGFLGLRELRPHLWVRPDNLAGGVSDVRRRLRELGLEDMAPVFALTDLDERAEASARGLWETEVQRAEYRKMSARIEAAIRRLGRLALEEAMLETFLLGGRALRMLAFDPLLPDAISPGAERRALVGLMLAYDRRGRAVWSRFMRERDAPALFSLLPIPMRTGAGHPGTAGGSSA